MLVERPGVGANQLQVARASDILKPGKVVLRQRAQVLPIRWGWLLPTLADRISSRAEVLFVSIAVPGDDRFNAFWLC